MKTIFTIFCLVLVAGAALAQTSSLYESFEAAWSGGAPAGWTKTIVSGATDWQQAVVPFSGVDIPTNPSSGMGLQGRSVAKFPASSAGIGDITRIESPVFDFSLSDSVRMRFLYSYKAGGNSLSLKASTDGGGTWILIGRYLATASTNWRKIYVKLDSVLANQSNCKLAFEATEDFSGGSDLWLDRVVVQYPTVTLRQIQEVPAESLQVAQSLNPAFSADQTQPRWTLQVSPYYMDTVTINALCVVPAGVITFTVAQWTMLLYDSSNTTEWGAVLVRADAPKDTAQLKRDGFLNVGAGDRITMVGSVGEFPTPRGFSLTQFQPKAGYPIQIVGAEELPKPLMMDVGDFYQGIYNAGTPQYVTGEPHESMIVEFHNLVVDYKVNTTRGTFSATDQFGNEISDYDYSHYFTLGHGSSLPVPGDTNWAKTYSSFGPGMRIDTLRGVIATSAQTEGPRVYRIAPLYPGDVVFSPVPPPPLVTTHRRYPVVVTPDTSATIAVKITQQLPSGTLPKYDSLYYSVNAGPFNSVGLTYQAVDTTYVATIPKQIDGSVVRYFIVVIDTAGQVVRLANSSTNTAIASDTSNGFFFYKSISRPLTIQDVQYTPYVNGRSPYVGAVTSLSGIITADTLHMNLSPLNNAGTNAWYMQSSNLPWSGIWVTPLDSAAQAQLALLKNGDSVTVTGTVQEEFDVTRLGNVTTVTKWSSGNPEPAPVLLHTGDFSLGNGSPKAEPYEGMLVQFANVSVVNPSATFSDLTEYSVSDGSGGMIVRRDGRNSYSNVEADTAFGKTFLGTGSTIDTLTGIVFYSFSKYKLEPRTNADFKSVVALSVKELKKAGIPISFELTQNYPNPFNPSTVIEYGLPSSVRVTLKIYNILGQEVRTLVDEVQSPGRYSAQFDARSLSSGVYFYHLQAGAFNQVKKMLLLK